MFSCARRGARAGEPCRSGVHRCTYDRLRDRTGRTGKGRHRRGRSCVRRGRDAASGCGPAHRECCKCRRLRRPRRANGAQFDAQQLPRKAPLDLDGQLRKTGCPVRADERRRACETRQSKGDRRFTSRRRAYHLGTGALQRRSGGDPHRPSFAVPRHARRVRQPGSLDCRLATDERGARIIGAARCHRRCPHRNRPARRLRAACAVAIREVRGDVLQLRVSEQRVPFAASCRGSAG